MKKEQIKRLINKYPFLLPRNVWTGKLDEDYDYSYYVGQFDYSSTNIISAWDRLFLLYCKNITPLLRSSGTLSQFCFSEIKEKWGKMCLYNFGTTEEVQKLTQDYENYSGCICCRCGRRATRITTDWIAYYCKKCSKQLNKENSVKRIHRSLQYKTFVFKNNKKEIKKHSLIKIDKEFHRCMKMSSHDFFEYIMKD